MPAPRARFELEQLPFIGEGAGGRPAADRDNHRTQGVTRRVTYPGAPPPAQALRAGWDAGDGPRRPMLTVI